MSAQPDLPAQDLVTIEIDGKPLQARKGAMIIEVADEAGIDIPRFCYHKKLSIAANCRMCMVEVEKVPKPLPACATPVAEGMKVITKSAIATGAQRRERIATSGARTIPTSFNPLARNARPMARRTWPA